MKKIIASTVIMCVLVVGFFCENGLVNASSCPGDDYGRHSWLPWELDMSADCTNGLLYVRYCEACYEEQYEQAQPKNHSWGKWRIKKSTYFKKGYKWRKCNNCYSTQSKKLHKKKMSKNKKKAYIVVKRYLKSAKKYNWKRMNKCFANKKSYEGFPTYKPLVKQYKRLNKRMSWSMLDIKGKGKKLTISAYVNIPNMYKSIYEAYKDNVYYAASHKYTAKELGDSIIDDYAINLKYDSVKMKKQKVKFKMIKTKKGWKIRKKTIRMVDIATCRYAIGTYDAELDFNIDFVD